ncbi:capsule assembly Wzi family protein [Psychromonas sp. Urea-02u-13]|uniref:capsule assembly Wzi family protein n=1 Tax=Psychromonas sp. Urea-02u-13 TaxID=2058326 RepID=UPI000C34E6F8|nr:capsule assembly Wzi family protein [Psychromonas sp. Urea-02u-13]PKG37986.1 capsule assembly Wzi family protein [Psychromonas sp. Urea-02u-13]
MIHKLFKPSLLACALFSGQAIASYHWVDANDLHLRADIQLLADVGVITTPTTTYPLMWSGVMQGINNANLEDLSPEAKDAYYRVNHRYKQYRTKGSVTKVSLGGANDAQRFQHYGSPIREKGEATISHMGEFNRFAYNLEATYAYDAADGDDVRFDGSYVSMLLGNWIITAGSYGEWYGQGWDTAITKSTNARPLPSLNITRNSADAFDVPLLEWLGPWTMTTGISWMNDDDYRHIQDTLLWSFRASIKPHPNFEFGVSRTAQICGEGKSCDGAAWWNMLTGDSNVYSGENPANQIAAVDARWGDTLYGVPYGFYWESMGEDAIRLDRFPPFQAKSYLYGADVTYRVSGQVIKTFFEFSDTNATCKGDGNCTYEHSTYRGGYRYKGRSIGSTYDNDGQTYTLGFIGYSDNGNQWKSNLRYLDLNVNNSNSSSPGGNTAAPIGEQAAQIDFTYIWPMFGGKVEAGSAYTYSAYTDDIDEEHQIDVWGKWSYIF